MDMEVRPEPTDDEREAILAALDPTRTDQPAADDSSWRRAALEEAVEGEASARNQSAGSAVAGA